ncbi:MAG TPA: glycosyltransferase family 39 protein, partial [Patescibacteria group bacterium]|nr:glycosyltransferase family 39 protein [Patescibacteria group bacterium]
MAANAGSGSRARAVDRSELIALGAILLVYLALVAFEIRNHLRPNFDERIFLDVGRQITLTGLPYRTYGIYRPTFFFDHTPLYVYWVAFVTFLGGPTVELVRATTLAIGVLSLLGVHWIGRTLRGPMAGLVGAAVLATNPFYATLSWFVRMEVPLCCALVFALLAVIQRRWLLAGLLIAVAVLLKEIALGFMAVTVGYVVLTSGLRAALAVGLPSVAALGAWFAYAAAIGQTQLLSVFHRWFISAAGGNIDDPRMHVSLRVWAQTIVTQVISLTGILAT